MMGTFKFGGSTVVVVFKNGFPSAQNDPALPRFACRPKQVGCANINAVIPGNGSMFYAAKDTPRIRFDDDLVMHSQRLVETYVQVGQSIARVNAHFPRVHLSEANATRGWCAPSGLEC